MEATNTQLGKRWIKVLTVILIIIVVVAPEMFFAILYGLFATIYHDEIYKYVDLLYFSFAIHYAMPMEAELDVFTLRGILNEDNLGRLIQFLHIASTKVIELTIFASIGNFIYNKFILKSQN